jgi:fatty-acyl-CoA synthase
VEHQTGSPPCYVWHALKLFTTLGSAQAIVYRDRRMSYADFAAMTRDLVAALRERGVRPGSTVAVLTGNAPESIALQLAMHLLGCRTVWIAMAPRAHQADFARQADVDTFVYHVPTHAAMGEELVALLGSMRVLCLGPGGLGPDLLAPRAPVTHADLVGLTADVATEPESIYQTSGTTGRPKLVHHRHEFFRALPSMGEYWLPNIPSPPTHLSMHRFSHVASQLVSMMILFKGGRLVLSEPIGAVEFLRIVERERINTTIVTPPVLYELLDALAEQDFDTSSLTEVSCGGAAAAPARLTQAIDRLGPGVVRLVYGMSELPVISELCGLDHDPEHPQRLQSCGVPFGDLRIEVRDENGRPVSPGVLGEVWVSSVMVMTGYWARPDLTDEVLADGWLRTRDVGRLDEDGYLYLVDRSDGVILTGRGSANVYSRPIEDVLAAHPQVRAAAVIKVSDDALGEVPHAFVVRAPGAGVTEDELRDLVTERLDGMWAPRGVDFVESLPLVGFGKVDKRALHERFVASRAATVAP